MDNFKAKISKTIANVTKHKNVKKKTCPICHLKTTFKHVAFFKTISIHVLWDQCTNKENNIAVYSDT